MIFVKSLTKYYKNRLILKINNINLNESSIVGILGFCGCDQYFNNLNEICYYLIFIAIAIIAVIFGTLRLNKTDCTR